jgi:hypothetical protein
MTQQLNDKVLTVVGAYETHKGTDEQYETISVQQLMDIERTNVPKDQARWVLCSTYNEPDGRKHKAQEERGEFVMVAIDLDTGNVQGKALVAAVQSFTGPVQMRAYASSSATKDSRKWRVLIPTLTPMRHDEWLAVTVALNQHIERELGVRPDRALERAGQPIYLPNTAPRTDGIEPLTSDTLIKGVLMNWREAPGADHVLTFIAEEEERQREHQQRATEARRKMSQARARPDSEKSVIEQFNTANDLEQVMAACGYKPGPRGGWRSPRQSSGSYATKVFDEPAGQYWVSLSLSDLEAGVGSQTSDGRTCFGDAFDLYAFHMHANDRKAAIKAAAGELGIKPPQTDIDRLAERLRANQLAKQKAAAPVPAGDIEFPEEPTPQVQQQAQAAIERAAESAAAQPVAQDSDSVLRTLPYVQASNLPGWEPPRELIEGMLIEGGMTVIYGDSNTGKSFLTLDMAAHITLGRDWFGRKVKQGAVVYLAAESPRSIIDRSRALADKLGTTLDNLFITNCPIDLYDPNGDCLAVVNTIEAIEREHGVKVCLIVADTLARIMGAGDENATRDMNVVVKNVDVIRAATRTQFVLIHHTGKDASKGARGSSALRAATDTEIEVSDPGNQKPKEFKVTKQRDLQGKGEVYGFILVNVNLGLGVFDNLMTTCYVQEAQPEAPDMERELSGVQRDVLDFIRSHAPSCKWRPIVEHIKQMRPTANDSTISRALDKLQKLNLITKSLGMYAPLGLDIRGLDRRMGGEEF